MRRHQHQLLLQKQLQRPFISDNRIDSAEVETRADSTLCISNWVSASPAVNFDLTNLDRFMESVTPVVPALYLAEARLRGQRTGEADRQPFFCLGDLWESFKEWSVYGAGVPLLLNRNDVVKQYYVPSLSGIQLYQDSSRLRRHGDDSDAESSRVTSSAIGSKFEAEKRAKGGADGLWSQHNLMNLNSQGVQRLTLRDKPLHCSSNNVTEISNSTGLLVYEYLEQEQPHHRKPLYDKVSSLASQFPDIKICRSCDLLPGSWVAVAWYPIYRIPTGPTLQNLDASFLTFHSLSTKATSKNQVDRKAYSMIASSKIALPVFGLASYKLRGSILTPSGAHECEQVNSLLHAADTWLRSLEVNLPDFQFFVSHNS